ncbi:hypothetical protein [Natronocalculus amylovorans]|uniref:DUF7974 domain-containing protein n=1 Tax=Natronocalculus amylovorans TaxID=2917812 RepID=A0AAE3G040_9EURY|nr:hypothetical protein [Natronocalculus amylovorans]MCL9818193.1 hypothetical protein [Natronocalculus amylovorans]
MSTKAERSFYVLPFGLDVQGSGPRSDREADPFGFDEPTNVFTRGVSQIIPQWLARKSVTVSIQTDKNHYAVDEPIKITILIRNRLPVPIRILTTQTRVWGWKVDGLVDASEEIYYQPKSQNVIELRAGETKKHAISWDGRIKRVDDRTHWEPLSRGIHTVTAFVTTPVVKTASKEIEVRS